MKHSNSLQRKPHHRSPVPLLLVLTAGSGPACAAVSDPLAAEPRLEARYRVHAEGIAVGELMARAARSSEVPLSVEPEVADDKVLVFGPPRPLREILADVA